MSMAATAPCALWCDPLRRSSSQAAISRVASRNLFSSSSSLRFYGRLRWRTSFVAMDASFSSSEADADEIPGPPPVFNRIYVRDPHKRLGVSYDASEMEVEEARSFLLSQYGRHERSREAIEDAHDRIIFESFRVRKRSKINLKTNLKKKLDESPPWVRKLASFVETPKSTIILQRAALYAAIGVWSVMNAAEGGPAFQVFVALGCCIYFINDRVKSLSRAFILGLGSLFIGWTLGSLVIPSLSVSVSLQRGSLELFTALSSYVFLWVACTFLK
ncbi:protein CHAPERONE-LIKE PROTEIN OF POR1, chloroplastic isoform X1 [Selaginella moellendorffii]|nr:protein CHAPERONE-LIKE PROTEIN OF POR1, chloroplastic isoform X1 [Selaginella moellendorffii]|eukprot:XP_002993107.2 protein CHAPERONE-LIKE PROTEIN OF POR1, chloroplastic isoform X1 [Selaginella moellendorffii]